MIRILLIDSYQTVLKYLSWELSSEGYDVITSQGDNGVMDVIDEQRPDIIIMEVDLYLQNGLELLYEIKKRYKQIPVIIHSNSMHRLYDNECWVADFYTEKSVDTTNLKEKIIMSMQ